ncbi:PREDICTED: src-like-adapter 2 [Tinamus guttatus]|uniref:src-like-adapter 2 n=1 Tax=Tinamus guttatus TaxID=94827 RepID=UPI00052EA977|nr:PREDICTED: src-like-adapter 2 [Tinamus guttatus]
MGSQPSRERPPGSPMQPPEPPLAGLVVSAVSGRQCHIPSSYVAKVWHRWLYEGISREKAEELLLRPGNCSGSFLIRESQTRKGEGPHGRGSPVCPQQSSTHYRIQRLENGWLYISPRLTFPSLHDLVDYYSECGDGLCCLLKEPCHVAGGRPAPARRLPPPLAVKKQALDWDRLDSAALLPEAMALPEEDSPISLGLRDTISSYLLLTDQAPREKGPAEKGKSRKNS